jgi:hypothetical protein
VEQEPERWEIAREPIEVWLRQDNMKVHCWIVYEDESTDEGIPVSSLSMRGGQREITGYLLAEGYEAVGRWSAEDEHGAETSRKFRPARSVPDDADSHSLPGPEQLARWDSFPHTSLGQSGIVGRGRCWHRGTDCRLYRGATNRPVTRGPVEEMTAGEAKGRGYGLCASCLDQVTDTRDRT